MSLNKKKSASQLPIYNTSILDTDEIYGSNTNFDIYSEKKLEQTFSYNKVKGDNVAKSSVNYLKKYYNPTPSCMKNYFFDRFPFFKWIRKYNFKNDFFKDLIAGLTIGIVHIPQGIFLKKNFKRTKFFFLRSSLFFNGRFAGNQWTLCFFYQCYPLRSFRNFSSFVYRFKRLKKLAIV